MTRLASGRISALALVAVMIVSAISMYPLAVTADSHLDPPPASQTFEATDNIDVWERAVLPLRVAVQNSPADDANDIVPNADWQLQDEEDNIRSTGRDRLGVFEPDKTVFIDFNPEDRANFAGFDNESVVVIAAHLDPEADVDDATTFSGALDLLTGDNANDNATFIEVERTNLTAGTHDFTFHLTNDGFGSGHYVFFLATNESGRLGLTVNGGNLSTDGNATIVGVEHVAAEKINPQTQIAPGTRTVVRGNDIRFTVAQTPLSGPDVKHALVVYDETTYTNALFRIKLEAALSKDFDIEEDSTLQHSIESVNGVAELEDSFSVFGVDLNDGKIERGVSIAAIIDFIAEKLSSPEPASDPIGTTVLDGSINAQVNDSKTQLVIETFGNWTPGTYRWIYVAGVDDTTQLAVDTGTVRVLAAPPTGNGGIGGGGGGGGAPGPPPGVPLPSASVNVPAPNQASAVVQNVQANQPISIDLPDITASPDGDGNPPVDVEGISVTPSVDEDFTLDIAASPDPPENVPDVAQQRRAKPLQYLEVEADLDEDDVEEAAYEFGIEKSTLDEDNQDPSNVVMLRYSGGEWEELETDLVRETQGWYLFTATTPGFSAFSIVVEEPDIGITGASIDDPEVLVDEDVTVTVTLENTGDGVGTKTVALLVDGEVVESTAVDLEGGETTEVTFTRSFDDAGSFDIAVDDTTIGTVSVEAEDRVTPTEPAGTPEATPEANQPDQTPEAPGESGPDGPDQPGRGPFAELGGLELVGIGIALVLAVLLVLLAYARSYP